MTYQDTSRRIRMGMVGGGLDSFIGPIHRMAAELDGEIELVAGAFSSNPEKSRASGRHYKIAPDRAYDSYQELMEQERRRDDAMDFVCIVTPNHLHQPVAAAALDHGFHVVSDKPAAARLQEALDLRAQLRRTGLLYALTYTYTGYPIIREARRMVHAGELGEIRKAVVIYSQGWLSEVADVSALKQAAWRVDPNQSGVGGALSDIGVHALNLLEYVGGRQVKELCASIHSLAGRALDDDGSVLLRLDNEAPGVLMISQVSTGEGNSPVVHLYGEKGGLHWSHDTPDQLRIDWKGKPSEIRYAASGYLDASTRSLSRMPAGHPEGVIEAFANIYRDFARTVQERLAGRQAALDPAVPGIEDGVRGMSFVEQALKSSRQGSAWVPLLAPAANS